jgi:hypothetical protein
MREGGSRKNIKRSQEKQIEVPASQNVSKKTVPGRF